MKTIGILGGMAPESTVEYYRQIIQASHEEGWEKRYPPTIIHSLNFEAFYEPLANDDEEAVMEVLSSGIESLARAGADFGLLASNTPHKFYDPLDAKAPIPLLSIVTATARSAVDRGFDRIGILGTAHTTTGSFYPNGFKPYDLEVYTPSEADRKWTHEKIFEELTNGVHKPETKHGLVDVVERMVAEHDIDAIALACTELPLVLEEEDLPVPLLDTTSLHARYAFDHAIEG